MTKNLEEHGLFSSDQQRINHKDFKTACLLAFYHKKNPKRNKKDERGIVIKNKVRLVAQGYTQKEGIDYDEVFPPVARIKAIRLFLACASFKDFMVYQMDVKSVFPYGKIEEEVYVCQPPGFEDPDFPNRVYKVEKALYGLHQAPRAWYETLSTYLLDNGFQRGKIDKTLFIRRVKGDILLVQVYVDDIIFGSTKKSLCTEFVKMMHKKFQMSSIGELTFFLGLQVKQKEDRIFISQDKYVTEILKKFGFIDVKTASTPMKTQKPLLKDADGEDVDEHLYRSMIGSLMYLTSSRPDIMFADSPFDLVAYTDSDYAGAGLDRKSTIGGCLEWNERAAKDEIRVIILTTAGITNIVRIKRVVNASRHKLTAAWLMENVNVVEVVFFEKPTKSEGFKEIVDFLNANPIKYALTVNPAIYCSCVKQFWDIVKAKMVNEEVQLQALVDKKKMVITESTIRRDLQLDDDNGVDCLPNAEIFKQLTLMGNMKREGKGFSGRVIPLFQTMIVQAHEEMGEGSEIPTDPHHTPIITQPSSSQPQRKQKSRKSKKKNTEDRLKLTELMDLCRNLQKKVLDLKKAKTAQDSEIASLKKKVKKIERRNKSRTIWLKRLRKVGSARRVESYNEASLGDQEDASKQGRKISDIDADAEVTLIDETQGRNDDNLMFDTGVLDEQEVEVKKVVSTAEVTTESATITTIDELTLAQTLIEIKAAKPKVRGVMIQELSEFTTITTTTTPAASKPSQDKGKAKMIEFDKPLKKKDHIMYDQEVALNLQAQLQAEMEEEERLTR
ncbi:putative ribonuclease H-like domain-containing protein [Tanacetum coccineum]